MDEIRVAARASPLSRAQVLEVAESFPKIRFIPHFLETTGDLDQKTSLRTLDKTDFFTKEVDALVLSGACRLSIHSAKDLPETLPEGLEMAALTRGVDPSDSLVMNEGITLASINPSALIATSSIKREAAVSAVLPCAQFCDIRGTILQRLEKLQSGSVDGVVIAEAALIRLGLTHHNRITLPGTSTPLQGQLAILARKDDQEMLQLFSKLDVRRLPKALYFGPTLPIAEFQDRWLHHYPLIRINPLPADQEAYKNWNRASHIIFTSKNAVKVTLQHLKELNIPIESLKEKTVLAIGKATASTVPFHKELIVAKNETQEGILELLEPSVFYFYPHSAISRPLISEALLSRPHTAFCAYTIEKDPLTQLPDLNRFSEAIFSSPSTYNAFLSLEPVIPETLRITTIGPVTQASLLKHALSTEIKCHC